MSQFSYGALSAYTARGAQLPVPGGYDPAGNLTRDPAAIEASKRALAIGYWKGSGLSLVLDMLAAMLSGGNATHQIPREPTRESGVSQIFLAIDPSSFAARADLDRIAAGILDSLRAAAPSIPPGPCATPASRPSASARKTSTSAYPSTPRSGQNCRPSRSSVCAAKLLCRRTRCGRCGSSIPNVRVVAVRVRTESLG